MTQTLPGREEFELQMSDPVHVKKMRLRANLGALVGTGIEWYEYFVYGSMAALVFPKLFFPSDSALVSTLESFASFALAFLVRPIGGAIFGHLGDRIGRRRTLIITLLVTGIATTCVGLLPAAVAVEGSSYPVAGGLATFMLLTLRMVQGIGVGGEWGGSVSMALEWGEGKKKGLAGAWPQMGSPIGLIAANGAMFLVTRFFTQSELLAYAWRYPFLFSGVLMLIGLWVRLRMAETPVFIRSAETRRISHTPVKTVFTKYPKQLGLAAVLRMSEQAPFFVFTVYVLSYLTSDVYTGAFAEDSTMAKASVTGAIVIAAASDLILVPVFGALADRVGRRVMYYAGCVALIVVALPYFWILNSGNHLAIFLAISCSLLPHSLQYGSQSSLIAEQFPDEVRATGSSVGYQLSSIIAGGPAPLIAAAIVGETPGEIGRAYGIAAYLVGCGILSALALKVMPRRGFLGGSPESVRQTSSASV
ncbi:MAG: MHS family MFS transporter [Bifidobacteriaceae bacterium]|jgi:MFS family permease|nr:MHS family MFS transporter [Bifidobacteriaceae bacterium]